MAEHSDRVGIENSQVFVPLLGSNRNQSSEPAKQEEFEDALKKLDVLLGYLGFHQSSVLTRVLVWSWFVLVGIVLPVVVLVLKDCAAFERYQIHSFEVYVVASQACLAAVSLLCLSHNLRKYGIKRFLTVDRQNSSLARFHKDYVEKIQDSKRLLFSWALACFILKAALQAIRILYAERLSWGSVAVFLTITIPWTYLSLIFLTAVIVFHLMCKLQIVHFDDYAEQLPTEPRVLVLLKKHIVLCRRLSKISHIFQRFLLLEFLFVNCGQFVSLLQMKPSKITLIHSCDFVLSAIVQVAGIILCLHGATTISHRAQEIASVASRWYALVTCGQGHVSKHQNSKENSDATSTLDESQPQNQNENPDAASILGVPQPQNPNSDDTSELEVVANNDSETDLNIVTMPTTTQLASSKSSYNEREAFEESRRNNDFLEDC